MKVFTRDDGDDIGRFCSQCGETISSDTMFCPTCGAMLNVSKGAGAETKHGWVAGMNEDPKTAAWITVMALLVWVVIGLAEGAHLIGSFWLDPHEYESIAVNSVVGAVYISLFQGSVMFSSGLIALACARFCYIRDNWHMALTTCLLAAVIPLALLLTGDLFAILYSGIGLLVWLRIYLTKPVFRN